LESESCKECKTIEETEKAIRLFLVQKVIAIPLVKGFQWFMSWIKACPVSSIHSLWYLSTEIYFRSYHSRPFEICPVLPWMVRRTIPFQTEINAESNFGEEKMIGWSRWKLANVSDESIRFMNWKVPQGTNTAHKQRKMTWVTEKTMRSHHNSRECQKSNGASNRFA
jgi:hypothetical protein